MTRGGSRSEWNDFRLFCFLLSITVNKTVIRNKNASPWEFCPPNFGKGHLKKFSPERVPPSLRFFDELNQIPRLAIQKVTERFKGSP